VARINVVFARPAVPAPLLPALSFVPAVPPLRSVALEADARAYAVNGYSGVLRASLANGLSIALGAGHHEVPGFFVEGQADHEVAVWKATSETIQVLRIGYRFVQAMETEPCSTVSSSFSGGRSWPRGSTARRSSTHWALGCPAATTSAPGGISVSISRLR
jgi:hypothetical protein